MSDNKYHNKYRVDTALAQWHDYDGGIYFITICTKNREHFFGKIEHEEMFLSIIGKHTRQNIEQITSHNPYAEVPLYVIMPNHLHFIVVIDHDKTPHDKRSINISRTQSTVETFPETSLQRMVPIEYATSMQSWLSVVIRQFKQSITRFANENGIDFAWQPRFHDHIIRNNDDLNQIATYIENNVIRWQEDEFYTP